MRFLTIIVVLGAYFSSYAQNDLTADQWREDLRYLQYKIHTEYQPLFHKVTKEKFDQEVDNLYKQIPNMKDHQVKVGIAEIVALFGYGHTALWLTSWRYDQEVDFHQMPYNLYWFTEGIYVQGVHKDFENALGAKVLKIGNTTIEEALATIKPVISAENDQFFKAHGLYYLGVPEVLHAKGIIQDQGSATLTLERDGNQFEVTFTPRHYEEFPGHYSLIQTVGDWLEARPYEATPYWLKNLEKKYYFEYLDDSKTVYVRQSEVQDDPEESLADFYTRVFDFIDGNEVERMVLDLRLNSGGNNYKNKPVVTGLIRTEKINQPGKLFVVLGRRTFSACQNLVNELENYTEAIFVGEATAENVNFFGDSRTERLPNSNLPVKLSYLWWQDKDPRDQRPWTPPQIAIELSFQDYMSNQDPVLEAILATSGDGILEPWMHLTDLFMANKFDELKTTARAYIADPKFRYYDFEDRINEAGYQLLGADRHEQALFILQLNTELFPESANCWDSLAEATWRSGDKAEAKQLYYKAIQMDPEGSIGENARTMLERIDTED